MITTRRTIEALGADAAEVAAEIERLKTPDLGSGQPPWRTIGFRIQKETKRQNDWIITNLSREQRRALSKIGTYGVLESHRFWDKEPPLEVDTWDEFLEKCAAKMVARRKETGCPAFPVYMSARNGEHTFPPIKIYPIDRQEQLAVGASQLAEFANEVAKRVAGVQAAIALVEAAQRTPALLEDAAFIGRWNDAIDDLNDLSCRLGDDKEYRSGYAATDSLGLASGRDRLVTGGSYTDDDLRPVPASTKNLKDDITKYGLAEGSEPF